jgi:hypothetical protein
VPADETIQVDQKIMNFFHETGDLGYSKSTNVIKLYKMQMGLPGDHPHLRNACIYRNICYFSGFNNSGQTAAVVGLFYVSRNSRGPNQETKEAVHSPSCQDP